ncbi:hypothetical protein LCGC14_2093780 [marine sediment metagenome]|uniref:Uncharacterized protein n=1 Tax=marine sediment metagenome TaxID=412755 RepID=A0A0F9EBW2_9ZZZZ
MEQIANPAGLRVLSSLVDLIRNSKEVEKIIDEFAREQIVNPPERSA